MAAAGRADPACRTCCRPPRRTRRPAHEIAARLRQLGYTVDVDLTASPVDKIRSNDLTYASNDLDGTRPWLDPDAPGVAGRTCSPRPTSCAQPVGEVADRLELLGYRAPDLDVRLPRPRPGGA